MTRPIENIVIVGGGSAGWLTAGIIAAEHRGVRVTLIESPDVKTIGVGEGTWPTMRDTLKRIGVSETDFVRECDASFKQGSKFVRWVTGARDDYYYHPFVLPHGYTKANLVAAWQAHPSQARFADLVSYQPHLCERGRAPKQITTPEFAAVANYAYHLDAGKFGQFLMQHCTRKLGVTHVIDHVRAVNNDDSGDIASLVTDSHGDLAGDLFIDCTGFAALLIGRHFGIPFISTTDVLFNDTALAIQIPYADGDSPIASQTIATAQTAGWIWDIGLPARRGVGYVYSSAHASDDEADKTLADYVTQTSQTDVAALGGSRRISINPGYRETFWHRNCVAVGISAGFVEPLEASALVLIELSAAMISDQMPATRTMMDVVARRFNERFSYRWSRVVEFLKLHYVLSQRSDSQFWLDNRKQETIPPRLQELLELWRFQPPSRYDFYQAEEIFPSASYQYVLYGMGFRPSERTFSNQSDDIVRARSFLKESAGLSEKMLGALPTNRELLEQIRQHGLHAV